MASKDFNNNEEFDIIDFDLNEYDEEFEKEEKIKLKEQTTEAVASKAAIIREKLKDRENIGEPNRDMLKTILLILFVIVIACLFLGLITFIVNSAGGTKDKDRKTEDTSSVSTEYNHNDTDSSDSSNNENSDKDDQKENFEDNIDEITNNVINDTSEDDTKDNTTTESSSQETTEVTTEATTTETPTTEVTTEAPTTEAPTTEAPATEAPAEKTPDTPVEEPDSINATPAE